MNDVLENISVDSFNSTSTSTITTTASEPIATVNTEVEPVNVESNNVVKETFYKSFKTEDDWKNYESSLNNKFSTNVLKEFNVSSKKELHDTISNYETQIKALQDELNGLKTDKSLVNVSDDYKEDALTIAQAKVMKNNNLSLDDAIKEVLAKNPTWAKSYSVTSLGTEKSSSDKAKNTDPVTEAFLKRNPQLKDYLMKDE